MFLFIGWTKISMITKFLGNHKEWAWVTCVLCVGNVCMDRQQEEWVRWGDVKRLLSMSCVPLSCLLQFSSVPFLSFLFSWLMTSQYIESGMVGLTPKWDRLSPNGTNPGLFQIRFALKSDLKKPRICPIWGQSDPLWSQTYHPWNGCRHRQITQTSF